MQMLKSQIGIEFKVNGYRTVVPPTVNTLTRNYLPFFSQSGVTTKGKYLAEAESKFSLRAAPL